MEKTTNRMFEQKAMRIAIGLEEKRPSEKYISEQVNISCITERSRLSVQEAAEKIWKEWKHCFELSKHLNA